MPHLEAESLRLPFSGSVPLARHCSHTGAVDAAERVGRQCLALLTLYRQHGPQTDRQAALLLGVERSTVNARRNELVRRGLVQAVDCVVKGPTGVRNTRWALTSAVKGIVWQVRK